MDRYSVETRLAREFGVATAAVYDRLYELCREKAERHADLHDGRFWVRIPSKDFPRVFPFLSTDTVSKALRRLRDEDLVTVGHYDRPKGHDGTGGLANWYAITKHVGVSSAERVILKTYAM